ncbi:uncharacterized protein [Lolium perenne]|uniref:uncharacterized protein n=1 Tax=Lolium perenne TaxID=4522 RepID=UPI0021F511A5|nr:uncharacterized protein LOC127339601 [Lolium perenne]
MKPPRLMAPLGRDAPSVPTSSCSSGEHSRSDLPSSDDSSPASSPAPAQNRPHEPPAGPAELRRSSPSFPGLGVAGTKQPPGWDSKSPPPSPIPVHHTPLLLSSGEETRRVPPRFFFQTWWFGVPGFGDLLKAKLGSFISGLGPHRCYIELWQCVARNTRQFLKGWGANLGKEKRDFKENLLLQVTQLDRVADDTGLDEEGWALRYHLEDQLSALDRADEEYWRQRSRVQWTLKGDSCTAYFHAIANGRRRKCSIPRLSTDHGEIHEQRELMEHIYLFYQGLMGSEGETRRFALGPHLWDGNHKVSPEENHDLELTFTAEELDEVLAGMKQDSAPGPDGLPVLFFKKFWGTLRGPILQILNDFSLGRVDVARLNYGIITLIPKVKGAENIRQFRPITLINVIFKFVAKAYATRLAPVAHRVIDRCQSAFIRGRCLHEGALALHEIVHELHVRKQKGLLLKLDFEKAYDRVNWDFLQEILLRKGFSAMMVHRLMQLVRGGQTAINVNGEIGHFFRNKRGVRQGDPLSPILFDFLVDGLAAIIAKANSAGHVRGLALLLCFENMSGLKINFDKSEVVVMGVSRTAQQRVANLLNCRLGKFPIKYLGLPISDRPLRVADWGFLPEIVAHRVEPWQGLYLGAAGRLELTNSCLSSLPLFAMSMYLLHDGTHKAMDRPRSRFFWEGVGDKRKYHMVDWATVCKPKVLGGLGVMNTKSMNIALMVKWIWKLYQGAEGLWADLIRAKYLRGRDLYVGEVPTHGSQFWNAIQKVKWHFKLGAKHRVRNGRRTYFWTDWVLDGVPGEWRLRFRRQFGLAETVEWDNLCREVQGLPLSTDDDEVSWALEPSGIYSTSSVYARLAQGAATASFKDVWRTRVPPKIKVFLWQLIRGRLPSGEQLLKRHGPSNGMCALCGAWEDCNHIFFTCPLARLMWAGVRELLSCDWNPAGAGDFIALSQGLSNPLRRLAWFTFAAQCWTLWNIRNKLAIEGKLIGNPADIFYQLSLHMQCWRVLVRPRDRDLLDLAVGGVRRLYARTRSEAT